MTKPRAVTEDRRGEDGAVAEATDRGLVRYFDTVAENYASVYTEDSLWGHVMRERKTRLLELLAGMEGDVLDVGCGPGIMVADILDLGCRFWGVDGSPRMIDQCLKQFGDSPDARFDVMNAEALRFPDDSFDAVTCVGVIDRVTRPEQAIAEMARVLKPNGRLLISFPNLVSPYAFWRGNAHRRVLSVVGPGEQISRRVQTGQRRTVSPGRYIFGAVRALPTRRRTANRPAQHVSRIHLRIKRRDDFATSVNPHHSRCRFVCPHSTHR